MQREIKFRAWHSEFAEMVYSSDETLWEKREFYPFCIPVGFSHYPTGQWDLMQYTGIKDKNSKEIYEGDIVEYFDWCYANTDGDKIQKEFIDAYGNRYMNKWNPLIGVVKWNNEVQTYEPLISAQEDYNNNCFAYVCQDSSFKDYPDSYYEVIGNIYENPELLNENANH